MFKLTVFLCTLGVALCGPLDGKIVGGREANIVNYPYQVSLRYFDDHICGGSILNQNTVLTAAHCTDGMGPTYMSIRAGNSNNNNGDFYNLRRIYQHESYDPITYDYDISVLKTAKSIVYKATVQPILMITQGQKLVERTAAVVTGWGATFEGDEETPDILRTVTLSLISEAACKKAYVYKSITDRMFCAQTIGKDSCQGDSGGPFVQNGRLIGVVSWGIGCARVNYPGVYTKLSVLGNWVNQYM